MPGWCARSSAMASVGGSGDDRSLRMPLHDDGERSCPNCVLPSQGIRCAMISPGAVATEFPGSSSEEATRKDLREFYKIAISSEAIASANAYAIEKPAEVAIDEVVSDPPRPILALPHGHTARLTRATSRRSAVARVTTSTDTTLPSSFGRSHRRSGVSTTRRSIGRRRH
jgi:hypothetical protein